MSEGFYKYFSIYINDKEHVICAVGEMEVSPGEKQYWESGVYEVGGGVDILSIDKVYVVRYGCSKNKSEIPPDVWRVRMENGLNGAVEFRWERHRLIKLNDELEREIVRQMEELYLDGEL